MLPATLQLDSLLPSCRSVFVLAVLQLATSCLYQQARCLSFHQTRCCAGARVFCHSRLINTAKRCSRSTNLLFVQHWVYGQAFSHLGFDV